VSVWLVPTTPQPLPLYSIDFASIYHHTYPHLPACSSITIPRATRIHYTPISYRCIPHYYVVQLVVFTSFPSSSPLHPPSHNFLLSPFLPPPILRPRLHAPQDEVQAYSAWLGRPLFAYPLPLVTYHYPPSYYLLDPLFPPFLSINAMCTICIAKHSSFIVHCNHRLPFLCNRSIE